MNNFFFCGIPDLPFISHFSPQKEGSEHIGSDRHEEMQTVNWWSLTAKFNARSKTSEPLLLDHLSSVVAAEMSQILADCDNKQDELGEESFGPVCIQYI